MRAGGRGPLEETGRAEKEDKATCRAIGGRVHPRGSSPRGRALPLLFFGGRERTPGGGADQLPPADCGDGAVLTHVCGGPT